MIEGDDVHAADVLRRCFDEAFEARYQDPRPVQMQGGAGKSYTLRGLCNTSERFVSDQTHIGLGNLLADIANSLHFYREVCQVTTWRKITLAALEEAIKNVADAQAVELHLHWQNLAKDSDLVAARDVTAKAQFALRNVAKRVQKAQKEYDTLKQKYKKQQFFQHRMVYQALQEARESFALAHHVFGAKVIQDRLIQ